MSKEIYPQQRAEDIYLLNCYRYYVLNRPVMTDREFDLMHRYFLNLYPQSAVLNWVGSDDIDHYPYYIREFRRPLLSELRCGPHGNN